MTITTQMIEKQITDMPNCWLAKNIKEFNLNYKSVPKTLMETFYFHFSEQPKEDTITIWDKYLKAFEELRQKGFFKMKTKNLELVVESFKKEAESSELKIEQSKIDDLCTVKTRKGEKSIHFEYNDFMDLFDQAYGVDNRDFFRQFGASSNQYRHEIYKRFIDATPKEIDDAGKLKPSESDIAMKMSIISKHLQDNSVYYDFWHKLIDLDFAEVSNGSMQTMWFNNEDDEQIFEPNDENEAEYQIELFHLIKKAIFKELKPSFEKNGIKFEDSIDFYVWW